MEGRVFWILEEQRRTNIIGFCQIVYTSFHFGSRDVFSFNESFPQFDALIRMLSRNLYNQTLSYFFGCMSDNTDFWMFLQIHKTLSFCDLFGQIVDICKLNILVLSEICLKTRIFHKKTNVISSSVLILYLVTVKNNFAFLVNTGKDRSLFYDLST